MNTFIHYTTDTKKEIDNYLDTFFSLHSNSRPLSGLFQNYSLNQLHRFSKLGKSVRGSLLLLSVEMFHGKKTNALPWAAGLELIQSSLLIHDDIMDNSLLRRGEKTVYAQYSQIIRKSRVKDPFFPKSMAICVGDIGFYLAFLLISQSPSHNETHTLMQKLTQEITHVGFAQMDDVYYGATLSEPPLKDIMRVYLYKTARYTFSLPLALGAILTGQNREKIAQLELLGEYIGLIFQIRDDEIEMIGDEKVTGKSMGSDIKENKKTLTRYLLYKKATHLEKLRLKKLFGNNSLTKKDIQFILSLIQNHSIHQELATLIHQYESKACALLERMQISDRYKKILTDLITFAASRTK